MYLSLLILMFTCFSLSAKDNEWKHVRGPDYNGHADNEKIVIPPPGKVPFLWKKKFDFGYSSFVVDGKRLFTQGQNRSGQYIIALDTDTGAELWRTRYGWPWELDGRYPGPYATPTVNNGKVYFTGCYGTAGCADTISGKLLWFIDLTKVLKTEVPSFGYACTPLVIKNKVYLTLGGDGGSVIALNASDGSIAWQSGKLPASYASPIPFYINNKLQIISILRNYVIANNSETGRELWRVKLSEGYDEHAVWPLIKENDIYVGSPFFRGMRRIKVTDSSKSQQETAEVVWHNKKMSNDIFSSAVVGEYIYGFNITEAQANPDGNTDGMFKCLDRRSGKEVWRTSKTGYVNVIAVKERLILFSEIGKLYIIEATPEEYRELWSGEVFPEEVCWPQPVLCNGRLYIRSEEHIAAIALDGQLASESTTGNLSPKYDISLISFINRWMHKYPIKNLISPGLDLLLLWYISPLLIFIFSAGIAAKSAKTKRRRFYLFTTIAMFLLITAPFIAALLIKSFIFTLPALIFFCFISVLYINQSYSAEHGKMRLLIPRCALAGFIVLVVLYFLFCRYFFITGGIGFPIGIIPAAPFALLFVKSAAEDKGRIKNVILFFISFSLYFWSGAALILLRT